MSTGERTAASPLLPDGMTDAQVAAAMAVSKNWPIPPELDGWVKSHDAIRLDMKDLAEALSVVLKGVEGGKALQTWQVENLKKYWPTFRHNIEEHHRHEEEIFFPFLETKFKLPPKMSSDHATLMQLLDSVGEQVLALQSKGADADRAAISKLLEGVTRLNREMCEHLKEEEVLGLPKMRHEFTHKEVAVAEDKITKMLTLMDMGWILRPMSVEERKEWLLKVVKAPPPIRALVLLPTAKKYKKKVQVLVDELKAGKKAEPTSTCVVQ